MKPTTWWFLAGTLAILLFVVLVVAYFEPLETLLLRETLAPDLQRDFGFTAGQIKGHPAFPDSALVITGVQPGGAFARAGVQVGDRPWDYHGRSELQFYVSLREARKRDVPMHFIRLAPNADIPRDVRIVVSLRGAAQLRLTADAPLAVRPRPLRASRHAALFRGACT